MYKQVIVIRTDLGMGKGKLAAQASHAAVAALLATQKKHKDWVDAWLLEGQKKVVLKTDSEDELRDLLRQTKSRFSAKLITDAGRTQLEPGTVTCIGIGPAPEGDLDKIISRFKLL